MKVIDLLNKIANGEEVPKKIKYDDDIYRHIDNYCYYCDNKNLILSDRIFVEHNRLNDEIEIVEDKPEKIETMGLFDLTILKDEDEEFELGYSGVADTIDKIYWKLDEVIEKLNYLLEKSDKE